VIGPSNEREARLQALWDAHREYLGHAPEPLPKSRADARKLYSLMLDKLDALTTPQPPVSEEDGR
jgi:uncharacterized protein YlaN (UPF0358 family)